MKVMKEKVMKEKVMKEKVIRKRFVTGTTTSFMEIYMNFANKVWLPPYWQRKLIWSAEKQDGWKLSVTCGDIICGSLIVFMVKGNPLIKFINDGMQRILSTIKIIDAMRHDGILENEINKMLSGVYINVQVYEYDTMEDAFYDFFVINLGTTCTPYELGKGILGTKLSNYEAIWEPMFDELQEFLNTAIRRLGVRKSASRDEADKFRRDDWALFYAYLAKVTDLVNLNSGKRQLLQADVHDGLLENKLQRILNEIGAEEADRQFQNFKQFISDQISLYEDCWKKYLQQIKRNSGFVPKMTHVRWWLMLSIWRLNNKMPPEWFVNLTNKLIDVTWGTSAFYVYENGVVKGRSNVNLKLGNTTIVPQVCKECGIEFFNNKKNGRKGLINPNQVKEGYHQSHIMAYSVHGPGETITEPAMLNRSRGNRDMDMDDLTLLLQ